ncbi:hypothetical protein [Candidatus Ulvibacter alkanivorans]|uniref:hypothetical protein n=1 Tax=Candidatus Ulvibacter alkanivorans TaxID=2267620 RepID=UPI000DF23D7C|nr:hypothetical protein [Candidatus Ulvibacter alkanivorans]
MKRPLTFVLLVFITCFSISCEEPPQAPQQTISAEEANTLEEEFKQTRAAIINDSLGFEDTREFVFSLDSLKKYIEYVEHTADERGLENLGLRIYFAAYPENSNYPDAGYATVFLVPTAQQQPSNVRQGFWPTQPNDENIEDIDPLNFSQGGRPPTDY